MNLTIPGEVVPKERPRFNRKTGTVYTPRSTRSYEEVIAYSAMAAGGKIDGPVKLTALIYTGNRKLDTDNALKSLLDGLQGHAFANDQQVCEIHVRRVRSSVPRVEIEVEATEESSED